MSPLSRKDKKYQSLELSRDYNCDSTTIRLRYDTTTTRLRYVVYDDTTTHSTTTEVIEIAIRLRNDYDVSRAPVSKHSNVAKNVAQWL